MPEGTENKRSPDQVEKDRVEIARRCLMGHTQQMIADDIGVSRQQISYDLKIIRQRWLESSIRDFDEAKAQELAKVDLIEAEFWEQWEKSKQVRKTRKREEGLTAKGTIDKTTEIDAEQTGNPAYLNGVLTCIERRCKILGLDSDLRYQDLSIALGRVIQAGYEVKSTNESLGSAGISNSSESGDTAPTE